MKRLCGEGIYTPRPLSYLSLSPPSVVTRLSKLVTAVLESNGTTTNEEHAPNEERAPQPWEPQHPALLSRPALLGGVSLAEGRLHELASETLLVLTRFGQSGGFTSKIRAPRLPDAPTSLGRSASWAAFLAGHIRLVFDILRKLFALEKQSPLGAYLSAAELGRRVYSCACA